MPDLPRWMTLDISSITSAANICGRGGRGVGWVKVWEGEWIEGGEGEFAHKMQISQERKEDTFVYTFH